MSTPELRILPDEVSLDMRKDEDDSTSTEQGREKKIPSASFLPLSAA